MIIWGCGINGERPVLTDDQAEGIIRRLVGTDDLEIALTAISYWTVNNVCATELQNARVFIMGDAAHRHPPSNGLGSNTLIEDMCNLAWTLAAVLKRQATPALLDSCSAERAPLAKPIFEAWGMDGSLDLARIEASMAARCDASEAAEAQRAALRSAIAHKKYEFDCHGVEVNQRDRSDAIVTDGQPEPAPEADMELHYQPTTWPGARLPHAWVFDQNGRKQSMLDLCGRGQFTLLTGIGGEHWAAAAQALSKRYGLPIRTQVIGPRQAIEDHAGEWAGCREIADTGCLLVQPTITSPWRAMAMTAAPDADLGRALAAIPGH